ncbi:MarR family winged helix-turn-helix transcriptional regulator [Propionicimonas sp.]|uniref:MarR family winged helix-turn-helix transcriptional regulator n=1 Tax=Propionicimonas sp. TaxID=1955623 RepID=UPI0039E2B83D
MRIEDERAHDRAEVAARLTPALSRVARRLRPASGELAIGHFSVLSTLDRFGAQRPSDLGRIERFTQPAVTRVVGALEERGLVARSPSPDDARSSIVEITDAGRRLLRDTRAEQAGIVLRLLDVLDDEQVRLLAAALEPLEAVASEASLGTCAAPVPAGR